jgi:hypothetical protein
MKLVTIMVGLVLALAAPLHAQPDETRAAPKRKSPTVAKVLGFAGSFAAPALSLANLSLDMSSERERRIGFGLIAIEGVVMVFGPSAGHWYTGRFLTPGLGIRAGSAVGLTAGALLFAHCASSDVDCGRRDPETYATIGLLSIGTVGMIVGTVWDALDAAPAAHRWNRDHDVLIAPTVGQSTTGLTLAGRF